MREKFPYTDRESNPGLPLDSPRLNQRDQHASSQILSSTV